MSELVSQQSDKRVRRERALASGRSAIRVLAANLMRISRGAGKPHEVIDQMNDFLEAYIEIIEVDEMFLPSGHIANWLHEFGCHQENGGRMSTVDSTMIAGALQMAASKLMGQSTQYAAGEHQLYGGINRVQEERESLHRKLRERSECG